MLFFSIILALLLVVVIFEFNTMKPKANIMLSESETKHSGEEGLDLIEQAARYHPYEGMPK